MTKYHLMEVKDSIDLNKFNRENKIGHGSLFEVFKIKEKTTGNHLAASQFFNELGEENITEQEQLKNMLTILKNLNHPSIVKFIGYSSTNFEKKNYPTFIYEYMPNDTLYHCIDRIRNGMQPAEWNDTKVLINIYGIASAMSYLHSHNILHRDLNPSNILLDKNLYPKLGGFYFVSPIEKATDTSSVGTALYIAPEIVLDYKYSKASDVYAFGMILFELVTNEKPFKKMSFFKIFSLIAAGERPEFPQNTPQHYIILIESCWADKPSDRPTFDEIIDVLKNDKRFITDSVDESEFYNYIKFIERSPVFYGVPERKEKKKSTSEPSKTEENYKKEIKVLKEQLSEIKEALVPSRPNNNSKSDNNFIDDSIEKKQYENIGRVGEGATSITYKLVDKKTRKPLCKKVLKYNNGQTTIKDAQNALKEFQVLYEIDHPCICKAFFINTSEMIEIVNKNKTEKVTTISIFLEFLDFSLKEFLSSNFVTNTMKSKIVVEIAHAMNFIHKHNMIHRDLKIENIMLNSVLEAKLVDFGLVKINECVLNEYSYVGESMTKGIGTFAYMSPEMLNEEDYDNKTDVYSFGVVLYFMFIGEIPKQSLKEKTALKQIKLPSESENISKFGLNLIKKCLSPDPAGRPSFEDILNELRKNSFQVADDVDSTIIIQRDKQLDLIEKIK